MAPLAVLAAAVALADPLAADLTRLDGMRGLEAEPIPIVRGGTAAVTIVSDDDPRDRWAASYLAATIREICGVRPETLHLAAGQVSTNRPVLMIASQPSPDDAFTVETEADGSVRFGGRADYAVFDWVERAFGVRYYWSQIYGGKWTPREREVHVKAVSYRDRPVFSLRRLSGGNDEQWVRTAKAGGGAPEFRVHSTGAGRCYGSPEAFADYVREVEDAIALRAASPIVDTVARTVSVSPWDEPYRCRCRWCRTLESHSLGPSGTASPIIWGRFLPRLTRYLGERHPDYRVVFLPYWNYVPPAPGMTPPDGVRLTAFVANVPGVAMMKDPSLASRELETLAEWKRLTGGKCLSWDYACWPAEATAAPYVFGRVARDHLQAVRGLVDGVFVCTSDETARMALSMYVWMRALWNPDLDVDAVYDGFVRRMFGPAAETVREVIALQERAWRPPTLGFPRGVAVRLHELMLKAEGEAAADPAAAVRFAYYASGFARYFGPGQ